MDTKFYELLDLLDKGTATQEQRKEFFTLINTGKYDHIIAEDWLEALRRKYQQPALEEAKERIYDRIYAEHIAPGRTLPLRAATAQRWWMSAAAAILLLMVAGVWIYREKTGAETIAQEENVFTFTGKDFVRLPDGSTAMLNEGSELTYTASENKREVVLSGEAYFDVTHIDGKPFIVHTGKVNTRVLGTAFNVKAYPGQKEILVTVTRGKVQVGDDERMYGVITPNEQIAVNTTTDDFIKTDLDAESSVSWTSAFLILEDVNMGEAADIIGRKYDVKITFSNPAVKKCRINARFLNDENLAEVLDMIGTVLHLEHERDTKTGNVIIGGKGCS